MTAARTTCPTCGDPPYAIDGDVGICDRCNRTFALLVDADVGVPDGPAAPTEGDEPRPRKSQATILVQLALDSLADFFHTPGLEPYVGIPVGSHLETASLKGKGADLWLRRLYHGARDGQAPGGQAVADALAVLRGRALFDGAQEEVHVRVAGQGENIYIDIGDAQWRTVKVGLDGWEVLPGSPVRFRRPRGLLPLPLPEPGGSLEELRPFLNVGSNDDFHLLVTWLVSALFPSGPYPVLVLNGEQGAAKSTAARVLRALIDPNAAPVRSEPREERDLAISANNGWVIALDNLSGLRSWLADVICRLATGGGFATRELYANEDEIIFAAQRPVILNGIADLTTRGDLADRALVLTLPAIDDGRRQPEAAFWAEFEKRQPHILGALLDVRAAALRNLPNVRLERVPRMADFALRGATMAEAVGWSVSDFLAAYASSRHTASESVLEGSLVTPYIMGLGNWTGTATELLVRLSELAPEGTRRLRRWPDTAQRLGSELRRLAPALRARKVDVDFAKAAGSRSQRLITIREVRQEGDASDASDAVVSVGGDALRRLATPDAPEPTHLSRYEGDGCVGCDGSGRDFPNDPLPDADDASWPADDGRRQEVASSVEEVV